MLGLLGSGHCVGMCGGLIGALGLSQAAQAHPNYLFLYNLGRITSYTLAGILVGLLGFWLAQEINAMVYARTLAGLMLILLGLYIGQWFNGLIWIEKGGHQLWRFIQPMAKRFVPIKSARDALLVGMVWGWLPCGLVYSALIYAGTQANTAGSALTMLSFGIGTLPSMLATGLFAREIQQFIQKKWLRSLSASLMIAFGLWTLPAFQTWVLALIATA